MEGFNVARKLFVWKLWVKITSVCIWFGLAGLSYIVLKPEKIVMLTVQTDNQVKTCVLPDGSLITLNKHSLLTYPERFPDNVRQIKLNKGEAFFYVMKKNNKPFVIGVNDITVKTAGRSFYIKNKESETEVSVETGIVQVIHQKDVVSLKPEEKVIVTHDNRKMKKVNSGDELCHYYRTTDLVLSNAPLWRVAEVLNEACNMNIKIINKSIVSRPLNMVLEIDSLDKALNSVAETLDVQIIRKTNMIIIQ
jgi:transmembrane sensor